MNLALTLLSIPFVITDIRHHRISNRLIVFSAFALSTICLFTHHSVSPFTCLCILISSPCLLRWGIGAGDIKLLSTLSFFFIPFSWIGLSSFLMAFSVLSALFLIQHLIRAKTFIGAIPLAPAICGAVIWCAR